jgi:hypothetical protein
MLEKGTRVPETPMTVEYGKLHSHPESPKCDITKYQQCLGGVMQIVDVKPDIGFAVSKCSQRTHDCREEDMKALLRIVHYLYISRYHVLCLRPGVPRDEGREYNLKLRGFCDSNFAAMSDGRSQNAYGFDLVPTYRDGSLIEDGQPDTSLCISKIKAASDTALSSCDAEITGITETAKTTVHLRNLLEEMKLEQVNPTPIYNDNESAITLGTKYNGEQKRVRYILPKINFIMDLVNQEQSSYCIWKENYYRRTCRLRLYQAQNSRKRENVM